MIRIALINQFYIPDVSPTSHLLASLAEDRAQRGDYVRVITSGGGYVTSSAHGGHGEQLANGHLRIHRIWIPGLGKKTVIKRMIDYGCFHLLATVRMITLPRQDIIVSLTTPPYIAGTAVLHKLLHPSTKIILWNMDCYPEVAERNRVIKPGGWASRIWRFMNRCLFGRLSHLVCLDTAMAELLLDSYKPRNRKLPMTIIPNWEKSSFFPHDAAIEPWNKAGELGLDNRFIVLYLGNAGYGHEFETVIEAAKGLRDIPVTFLFIGGGKRWPQIQQAAAQSPTNIVVHDYVPKEDTPSIMVLAQCSLTTLRENALGVMSPSKLHANLAMSLPALYIGPPKGNVDDAIRRFGCGRTFALGDVDGVVAFVRRLYGDSDFLETLRGKARYAFEQAYCDTVTLKQFDKVLVGEKPSNLN